MKHKEIINRKISDINFIPMSYDHGDWFFAKLLDMGFYWVDDTKPHFKLSDHTLLITISPYPNVVLVEKYCRMPYSVEIYAHSTIPQNETELGIFLNRVLPLL